MRLVLPLLTLFLIALITPTTALAGAGPPTDSRKLPRKYACTLTLQSASYREDAGPVSVTLTIGLVRTFATDEVVTVTVGKAHDNARPGRDYTVSADTFSVRILAGNTSGSVAFQFTPVATGSESPRRITLSAFGERVLYTETHIVILPVPSGKKPTTGPTAKSGGTGTPTVTHAATPGPTPTAAPPRVTPRTVPTPSPVPTPVPVTPRPTRDAADASNAHGPARATSARQSQQGCTEEDRRDAIAVRTVNPTGPYCILSFDHDKRCYIMVYWEEEAGGAYGHTVLYEGSREVDFLDFHPQCTRHRYN